VKTDSEIVTLDIPCILRRISAEKRAWAHGRQYYYSEIYKRCNVHAAYRQAVALQSVPLKTFCEFEHALQQQPVAARPDPYPINPILHNPSSNSLVPIRHRVLVQVQLYLLALSWVEAIYLHKRLQHEWRMAQIGGSGHGDVELHDLRSGETA